LINHPEANKKGEWVNSASYKKCKELFLQIEEFPMIRIVLAVTTPSVLKMMKERMVRMVVNMKVSLFC
jgi:hypothetical protein